MALSSTCWRFYIDDRVCTSIEYVHPVPCSYIHLTLCHYRLLSQFRLSTIVPWCVTSRRVGLPGCCRGIPGVCRTSSFFAVIAVTGAVDAHNEIIICGWLLLIRRFFGVAHDWLPSFLLYLVCPNLPMAPTALCRCLSYIAILCRL